MPDIYIFNPEHDLALANNDVNFNPPLSAVQFANDLSCLALWYAPEGAIVISDENNKHWQSEMAKIFPQMAHFEICATPICNSETQFHPWGWDKVVLKHIAKHIENSVTEIETPSNNVRNIYLPNNEKLEKIKNLSHRRVAILAHNFVINNINDKTLLRIVAIEIELPNLLSEMLLKYNGVVFKAPWSGSGKGLCWAREGYSTKDAGWCNNIIAKQGSVIAEQIYDVKLDFAMLFSCNKGKTTFEGFSVFETRAGIYRSNKLMSNEAIIAMLKDFGLKKPLIDKTKDTLIAFIDTEIATHYNGVLGVDMFLFEKNGAIQWHPCVEINLRNTMGYVSKCIFDKIVAYGSHGTFYIDYFKAPSNLHKNHAEKQANQPLKIIDNKVVSGYLSLTPIYENTKYRASIEIFE